MLLASGCLPPTAGTARVRSRRAIKQTYTVPRVSIEVGPEAMSFRSPHFLLQFEDEIVTVRDFETLDGRESRGRGALLYFESQYEFLTQVLGVEPLGPIRVVVAPRVRVGSEGRASEHDAYAQTHFQRLNGGVAVSTTLYFGIQAFSSPGVRAHEMFHAFAGPYGLPPWLDEGLAVLVEAELIGGAGWAKTNKDLTPIGQDPEGYNLIQTWRQAGSSLPFRDIATYSYAYSIVSVLREQNGDQFFPDFFRLLRQEIARRGLHSYTDEEIVALMSAAAGRDLLPFFRDVLRFRLDAERVRAYLEELRGQAHQEVAPRIPMSGLRP